jgi:cytochrome c peroxidase
MFVSSKHTLTCVGAALSCVFLLSTLALAQRTPGRELDSRLTEVLVAAGFTGRIESTLESRLGRRLDPALANLGRLLWFDVAGGLRSDNTCGGCHSPGDGFGDSQSIAIGVQSNLVVGRRRVGPRNQRRTPSAVNTAFYPKLMWNGRFVAPSGDPFDNSQGFAFPAPEGTTAFPSGDPSVTHLLIAQAHIPPTELVEAAGFTGTAGTIGPDFDLFDDGLGTPVPPPDPESGSRNEPIRQALVDRLNASHDYRREFATSFPSVATGGLIDFLMFARAIAEFEFTLTFANAPIDRFARGETSALTPAQKRGALTFFGRGRCVECHAVKGASNEMFSDFQNHVIGVPQVAPTFGVGKGNMIFDGPAKDEDFGLEQVTGNSADRYKFRSSPLRNVAVQPSFFHNGAFTRLDDAIRHHLDVFESGRSYNAEAAGLEPDIDRLGPIGPVLARVVHPALLTPITLTDEEFRQLVAFVREGLLDDRARKEHLCSLVPTHVPSGLPTLRYQACLALARE